jgi:hypothetical protein
MANDELGNRKIFNSAFNYAAHYHGPTQVYWLNQAMPALAAAVAEAVDFFEFEGRIADSELCPVNVEALAAEIRRKVVRKGLRNVGTREEQKLERAFRPIELSQIVLRMLLTHEKYGLLGRLPVVTLADLQPQAEAQPQEEAPTEQVILPETQRELEAGRRASARFAEPSERTRQEMERGAEVSAKYQKKQVATG